MSRMLLATIVTPLFLMAATPTLAKKPPENWDGLQHIASRRLDAVYLLPGADFRIYTKVMLDPTEVAFRKNWQRDQSSRISSSSISNEQVHEILDRAKSGFEEEFVKAYQKAGYQVVTSPGPDVLRLSTAVINLDVVAPDTMEAGRSRTFSREAGSATLVLEARDSSTGALLGRAVDASSTGDSGPFLRNSVTNIAEFEQLFSRWAKISVSGLAELKALSPISSTGQPEKK